MSQTIFFTQCTVCGKKFSKPQPIAFCAKHDDGLTAADFDAGSASTATPPPEVPAYIEELSIEDTRFKVVKQ